MNKNILNEAKQLVEAGDLDGLKLFYADLRNSDVTVASDWLFQKVYLHACLKKKQPIVDWMMEIYNNELDDITKISLKQMFPYGRWLLAR